MTGKLVNESKWWNVFDLKNSNKLWVDLIKLDDILFKRVALIIIWAVLMFTIHHAQHPTDIYRLQRAVCGTSAQKPNPSHSVNHSMLILSVYTVPLWWTCSAVSVFVGSILSLSPLDCLLLFQESLQTSQTCRFRAKSLSKLEKIAIINAKWVDLSHKLTVYHFVLCTSNYFHHSCVYIFITFIFASYVLLLPALRPLSLNNKQRFCVVNGEWWMKDGGN